MAAEPARPEPVLRNGRGRSGERPAYRKTNKQTNKKKPTKKQNPSVFLYTINKQLEDKNLKKLCHFLGEASFPGLLLKITTWASLVAQWLGVRLPMQGTRVRAPVREDPTCRGVAGPMSHGC